jgi:hypothetical protein
MTATWSGAVLSVQDTLGHSINNLNRYDALCQKHAEVLNAQPALVEAHVKLREKITLLSLLQLILQLCLLLLSLLLLMLQLLLLLLLLLLCCELGQHVSRPSCNGLIDIWSLLLLLLLLLLLMQ